MGAAVSTTVNTAVQQNLNTITEISNAACNASCTQQQSGNTVFLDGSTTGNIAFIQNCTVSADCQIKNSVMASATAIQGAIQQGSASPSWYIGAQINTSVNTSVQDIQQRINQTLNSTCGTSANQTQTDNLVYARNSQTGDISFVQNSNVQFDCVLSNIAKGTAASTQKADQVANAGGIGALGLIIVIIIIVIVIVIVISIANKKKKQQDQSQTPTSNPNCTLASPSTPLNPKFPPCPKAPTYGNGAQGRQPGTAGIGQKIQGIAAAPSSFGGAAGARGAGVPAH